MRSTLGIPHFMRPAGLFAPLLLVGVTLSAQNVDSIRASYTLSLPQAVPIERAPFWISPGSSSGTPTAYGAEFGDVFFGAGYQARTRYTTHVDGDAYFGLGLGNPRDNLGIELNVTSFTTVRHGFFKESSFSFKIHRHLPKNFAIAYGWEDAIHSSGTDGGSSMYGVLTSTIPTRDSPGSFLSSVTLSAGIGNGRFQTERAFSEDKKGVNGFGSIGVRVFKPISLIADWTGQDLMLGASLVPFPHIPFFLTPAFADVTGTAGDGARFVMGAGLDISLLQR
jgi:hypothetical protein